MIIERRHYFFGALIIALALFMQPISTLYIQTLLGPKLSDILQDMQVDPLEEFFSSNEIDQDALAACMADEQTMSVVDNDVRLGESLGIQGTPATFLGRKDASGNIVLYKEPISGALPEASVREAINATNKVLSTTTITNTNLHIYGSPNAETFLVKFSDLDCPFCASFFPTATGIVDSSNGKVALVYKHFPLSIHPDAYDKSLASECVAKQKGENAFFDFVKENFAQLQ